MPKFALVALAMTAVSATCALSGGAAATSLACTSPALTPARTAICSDRELLQADTRLERRVRDLQRRKGYGLYLGIRYWVNRASETREACATDKACLLTSYRSQHRLLERLQVCLDNSIRKRSCLRAVIQSGETAAARGGHAGRTRPQ